MANLRLLGNNNTSSDSYSTFRDKKIYPNVSYILGAEAAKNTNPISTLVAAEALSELYLQRKNREVVSLAQHVLCITLNNCYTHIKNPAKQKSRSLQEKLNKIYSCAHSNYYSNKDFFIFLDMHMTTLIRDQGAYRTRYQNSEGWGLNSSDAGTTLSPPSIVSEPSCCPCVVL